MKRICAWCKVLIGEKEPLADTSVTHGICKPCFATIAENQASQHSAQAQKGQP